MPKINVTSSMDEYFDLHHIIRSSKPGGNDITTDVALRTFFGRVVKGQSSIFTAPFAKDSYGNEIPITRVMDEWDQTLKSIATKWPSLYEFENDLRSKVGPLSVAKPLWMRLPDIEDYYKCISPTQGSPIAPWAVWDVLHEWQRAAGIRVRSAEDTLDKMRKSTNSGAPYFDKRRAVLAETGTDIGFEIEYQECKLRQRDWEGYTCATLGWRGQEGGIKVDEVKQRVVWMFPLALNILELSVYQPLIETAQNLNLVPSWVSMDEVDKRITALFDTKRASDLIVCTDFTKFDQHFNQHLQSCAEEAIEYLLTDNNSSRYWLKSVFPAKYMIPMMYNYGLMLTGRHGMASGSGGTNVDETLAHRALQYEAAGRKDAGLNPNSMCLGDDGVLSYDGITVKDVIDAYSSHGLVMNTSKQHASENDCIYLRRWHHNEFRREGICVGVYSTFRALGRLRYTERWMSPDVWTEESVALRQLSIIENCKHHPLREEFAEFCMKRDKFRLGLDIPGFLDNIETVAKKYIDLIPGFLGYTKSLQAKTDTDLIKGISSWWIVNYLKSKQ